MSHRLVRRKEKVVYEDIPVIGVDNVEVDVQEKEDTTPTVSRVIVPNAPLGPIITLDTVKHDGALEPMKRLAEKYTVAPVVTIKNVPIQDLIEAEVKTESTKSAIINVEDIPTEPIDESLPGYGKIFGGKKKEPIKGS